MEAPRIDFAAWSNDVIACMQQSTITCFGSTSLESVQGKHSIAESVVEYKVYVQGSSQGGEVHCQVHSTTNFLLPSRNSLLLLVSACLS